MAIHQENVSKILSVLSHKIRREILLILSEKGESSFTDFRNALSVDTGKLSFHIRSLSSLMEQTPTGKYKLSRAGESAIRVIKDIESWAEAAGVKGKVAQLPLASFSKRTFAFLIDFGLMTMITILLTLPETFSLFSGELSALNLLFVVLGLLWVYSTLLEGFNSQSLGKRMLGLKVVRTDGKKMSYDHAGVRNFGKAFLLPFDLVVGLQRKDTRFIRYFDKFAGTTVIDLRQQPS
jgi:uncharacterized RDD family membrane protein YckC/DNA-binding HxlR family transcriptional regulator